ncbi:MAG: urea ABC transporter permease subunit UrtB [Rikenellaceae bacterium]
MLQKIWITALSLVFSCQLFAQSGMSVGSAITDILGSDKDRISESCKYLSTTQCDSTIMFATAALSGELYTTNAATPIVKVGNAYKTLFGSKSLSGAELESQGLRQVTLSRKDRRTLLPLQTLINTKSPDHTVRMEAYLALGKSADRANEEFLKSIISEESNEQAVLVAQESLYELYLSVGSDEEQSVALDYIRESRPMRFANSIKQYMDREDINNTNRAKGKYLKDFFAMIERNNNINQNIFSGLSLGSILILVSLGLSVVYGLAGIINMSHGEFLMIGAYTTYCVQQLFEAFLPASMFDFAFFLSLPLSFIVAALFGLVIERLVLRHLYSRPLESMLATLGISLILIQLARTIFGDLTTVKAPAILSGGISFESGLILPYNRLFIIGLTIVIFAGVYLLFQRTRLGVRIRAVTQNRNMSACVGISTKKIDMITFMLGSGLAGIAGCAITLIGNVVPNMGQTYIVDSFLVVVTGGVGKLAGCAVSGLGIGVLSKFFEAGFEAVYGKVLILLLIIIFLQYKPKGLFADKGRIGDD